MTSSEPVRKTPAFEPFTVRLTFSDDLRFFLKRGEDRTVLRRIKERTSVKDVIEACGVPHPEVGLVTVGDQPATFSHVLNENVSVNVHSVNFTRDTSVHDSPIDQRIEKFVADGHLGKLARNLRLLGFDVSYAQGAQDRQLLETMQAENRALLTRDRRLLMHSVVEHGYFPRSQEPEEQTIEVMRRFRLEAAMAPFTRCLTCNALLESVAKTQVIDRLEPLTKRYYESFRRCVGCGKIYWGGSHFAKLRALVERIRRKVGGERGTQIARAIEP